MELGFCEGNNLENLLEKNHNRKKLVAFVEKFLRWMKDKGFFWQGAAPRNIIINDSEKIISILDFERPIAFQKNGFSKEKFDLLIRGTVIEEFSCFLFKKEQKEVFNQFFVEKNNTKNIRKDSIASKRQLLLLDAIFGDLPSVFPRKKLEIIEKIMYSSVTPFFVNNKPFFPIKYLDKIKGSKNYVKTVLKLSKLEKKEWSKILKK
jgi:hypothetical protein